MGRLCSVFQCTLHFREVIIFNHQLQMQGETTQSKIKLGETSNQSINPEDTTGDKKLAEVSIQGTINKKIIIGIVIGVLLLAGLIIGLAVGLTRNKTTPAPVQPAPTDMTICDSSPSFCTNVPEVAKNYILGTYTAPNEIKAMLLLSQSFASISEATVIEDQYNAFERILRAAECLDNVFVGGHTSHYQNLFNAQMTGSYQIQTYLSLAEAVAGRQFHVSSTDDLAVRCQGTLASESPSAPPVRRNLFTACTAPTEVLLFIGDYGQTPTAIIQNVRAIQKTLVTDPDATFTGGYMYLGAKKSVTNLFATTLVQFLTQQGANAPSQETAIKLFQLAMDQVNFALYNLPTGVTLTQTSNLLKAIRKSFSYSLGLNIDSQYYTALTRDVVIQHLREGKKVVMVAHGGGSWISNYIYNLLSAGQQANIAQIFIAPYADTMADSSGAYLSHDVDVALVTINQIVNTDNPYPAPLASNKNDNTFSQLIDSGEKHGVPGYMQTYGADFITLIKAGKTRASSPSALANTGPITVTVNWNSEPDLDLHVIEPTSHVWSGNTDGNVGKLDRVDSDGYGPEYYYSGCPLQAGNYQVKINYVTGTAHAIGTIAVTAGTESYRRAFDINTIYGTAGNDNPPYLVCTINIVPVGDSYRFKLTPGPAWT